MGIFHVNDGNILPKGVGLGRRFMGGRGKMKDVLGENFIWTCGAHGNPLISGRDEKPKSKEDKTILQVS